MPILNYASAARIPPRRWSRAALAACAASTLSVLLSWCFLWCFWAVRRMQPVPWLALLLGGLVCFVLVPSACTVAGTRAVIRLNANPRELKGWPFALLAVFVGGAHVAVGLFGVWLIYAFRDG